MLPGTDAPFVAPKPFSRRDLTDGQTRSQGQHAWRERLTRRGAGPPGARGGRGAGSLRFGAGLGVPHLCAGPAQWERSECVRRDLPVPTPLGRDAEATGSQALGLQDCTAGKEGQSPLVGPHHCSIGWYRPFSSSAPAQLSGVSCTQNPSALRPYPSTPTLATSGGGSQLPREAPATFPGLCSTGSLCQERQPLSRPSSGKPSLHDHTGHPEPHPPSSPDSKGLGSWI